MSLTEEQISLINDLKISSLFRVAHTCDTIHPFLQRGIILTKSTKIDKIRELYDIYVDGIRKRWSISYPLGLKHLMIQHGITYIQCFGCDKNVQFNDINNVVFIRIYKTSQIPYICCNECATNCPTIDMNPIDAQRFQLGKRGNIKRASEELKIINDIYDGINKDIKARSQRLDRLKQSCRDIEAEIKIQHDINEEKSQILARAKKHESIIVEETKKQEMILQSINDAETKTKELKEEYDSLFEKQFKVANDMAEIKASVEEMSERSATALSSFGDNLQVLVMQTLDTMSSSLKTRIETLNTELSKIETTSETITEKLAYNFKCAVCMGAKNTIWSFDCGHTLCKTCIDKIDTCTMCNKKTEHKIQIFI